MKKKVAVIFGTRPEAIKMAPVIHALQQETDFETTIIVTAQHRQMLDQVLDIFEIKPDYDLHIMQEAQDLYTLSSKILLSLKEVLNKVAPDLVLVHGDTTTAFVSSLAAFYQKIAVGHVEAGLRTYNLYAPWPEEANRQLIGVLAQYHFAPTLKAKENLLRERKNEKDIFVTGNTVIDALYWILEKFKNNESLYQQMQNLIPKSLLESLNYKKIILVTGHRRENFGKPLEELCFALKEMAKGQEVSIVFPVHLNPNVFSLVQKILADTPNIYLLEPIPYPFFIALMYRSYIILTDSGGVQEEASALGKPLLIMRKATERGEVVEHGCAKLIAPRREVIVKEVKRLLNDRNEYEKMVCKKGLFGDGRAALKIASILKERL